jgi:hypothetical protein
MNRQIPAREIKARDEIGGRRVARVEFIPADRHNPERVRVAYTDRSASGMPADELVWVLRVGG